MVVNELDVVPPDEPLPELPVARALWIPRPNLKIAATAWIYAGGAHHTGFSQALTTEHIEDFAKIAGVELLVIDSKTELRQFQNEIRWNNAAYAQGCPKYACCTCVVQDLPHLRGAVGRGLLKRDHR